MKNVLVVVYYFPPMGGSGVQRPLKFVKYLRHFGWNPIVLAPYPGVYHTFDESLEAELEETGASVYRVKANTPFHVLGNTSRRVSFVPDRIAELARMVSSFFFIPDNKTGWIKPAVAKAREVMQQHSIDLIFSTSPPPSNHLISAQLGSEFRLPVVMDFRDDWLEYQSIYYPTRFHKRKNARIERDTVRRASGVVANNATTMESVKSRTDNGRIAWKVISHGFDPQDFEGLGKQRETGNTLALLYSGFFYQERQPDVLLNAMARLVEQGVIASGEFELWFQGGLEQQHYEEIQRLGLEASVVDFGFVEHRKAVQNVMDADVLWFIVKHSNQSRTVTPGKLYEYMAAGKPILGMIGPGDSRRVLEEYQAGFYCDPEDAEATERVLGEIISRWRSGRLPAPDEDCIHKYNRKHLTGELAAFFDQVADKDYSD